MTDRPIGDILATLREARERKQKAAAKLKTIDDEVSALETELMITMEKQGLKQSSGSGLTVSISRSKVPKLTDWDAFWRYARRNDASHLFERRVHSKAWREECDARRDHTVPGVEEYERVSLHVTKTD